MFKCHSILAFALALIFFPSSVIAQDKVVDCVMQLYLSADANLTLADIREHCNVDNVSEKEIEIAKLSLTPESVTALGVISRRIIKERQTEFDPYVITPHKINYVLPLTITSTINKEAYSSYDGYEDNLEDVEAKFQLSFKVPLNYNSMLIEGGWLVLWVYNTGLVANLC